MPINMTIFRYRFSFFFAYFSCSADMRARAFRSECVCANGDCAFECVFAFRMAECGCVWTFFASFSVYFFSFQINAAVDLEANNGVQQ